MSFVLLFSALVPSGTDVILDLNGQTINRNLTEPAAGGSVFRVEGRLTIMDSSDNEAGKITGGFNTTSSSSGLGGGILVDRGGEVILKSGTIRGNRAFRGGGILNNYGTLTIEGGTIEYNTARSMGGGIIAPYEQADFSGSPVIIDNQSKRSTDEAYHYDDVYITVQGVLKLGGELGKDASIKIYHALSDKTEDPVTVTRGLS